MIPRNWRHLLPSALPVLSLRGREAKSSRRVSEERRWETERPHIETERRSANTSGAGGGRDRKQGETSQGPRHEKPCLLVLLLRLTFVVGE